METSNGKSIQATVQSIDGDRAVLLLPDGQVVRWPVALLHTGVKAGDKVELRAGSGTGSHNSNGNNVGHNIHELAHEVLNKIFGSN